MNSLPHNNPFITSEHRLEMTTSCLRYYTCETMARHGACQPNLVATATDTDSTTSMAPNVWKLDSLHWTFTLCPNVRDALSVVLRNHHPPTTTWQRVTVPSNWTMDPTVTDGPIYTNIKYPFSQRLCLPPFVPHAKNPTGVYQLELTTMPWSTDSNNSNDQYNLCFHGVESCFYLYVNQRYVGYSQDSRLSATFDTTPYLNLNTTGKKNTVLIQVVVCKWCTGSYLEDQDHWHHGGIHRSVELHRISRDATLRDFHVTAHSNGLLQLTLSTTTTTNRLECKLYNDLQTTACGDYQAGDLLWTSTDTDYSITSTTSRSSGVDYRLSQVVLSNPKCWSAEHPHLYTLIITVYHEDAVVQVESCRVGFRTIQISRGQLLLNQQPITICGINRHEHDPDTGKVISLASMNRDLQLLKQNNFNAVRTSHYPNAIPFYRLADYYGIYVCDEANVETHGIMPMGKLADDVTWSRDFVQRVKRMVQRDINHTCIILWSLGNESGQGCNLSNARHVIQSMDARPILYEGGGKLFEGTGESTHLTDVICPMYTSIDATATLTNRHKHKPLVLCEYSHAMGNSNGNLHMYWNQLFHSSKYPRIQGGFLWDMMDQGLRTIDSSTQQEYFGYGGDFGDEILNDQQFCINGIFTPDREPHPVVSEIKYLQQPIAFRLVVGENTLVLGEQMKLRIQNRFSFRNLSELMFQCFVTSNMSLDPILSPMEMSCQIPTDKNTILLIELGSHNVSSLITTYNNNSSQRLWLNVTCRYKETPEWAINDTHVIAKEQFELLVPTSQQQQQVITTTATAMTQKQTWNQKTNNSLRVNNAKDFIEIWMHTTPTEKRKIVIVEKSTGTLRSYSTLSSSSSSSDMDCISCLKPNYTRAVTDNDRGGIDRLIYLMPRWIAFCIRLVITFVSLHFQFSYWHDWKQIGLHPNTPPKVTCEDIKVNEHSNHVDIIAKCIITSCTQAKKQLFRQTIRYSVYSDGNINVSSQVTPLKRLKKLSSLPRVGFQFVIDERLHNVMYLGSGPDENYPDRKTGSDLGLWQTSPSKMGYNYIVPSENGNRSDCSWIAFQSTTNDEGHGVLIANSSSSSSDHATTTKSNKSCKMNFSALLHSQQELHNASHTYQLEDRSDGNYPIFVNLDHYLMGLGGDVGWNPCVYPEYILRPQDDFSSSFWLLPLIPNDDPAKIFQKHVEGILAGIISNG